MQDYQTDDPEMTRKLVVALDRKDGDTNFRPVHTHGVGATGTFIPSQVAAEYCVAEHFRVDPATRLGKKTPVTVRFSNGLGSVDRHDGWNDVRGLAVRFHLKGGAATDLIAMTLPEFFSPTPQDFLDFMVDGTPVKVSRESPWRKILDMLRLQVPPRNPYPDEEISPDAGAIRYANTHPKTQFAVFQAAALGAPVSYARASYHAVHTFIVTGRDGVRRNVRFNWQPVAGVRNILPVENPDNDYLRQELFDRLEAGPAKFMLMMSIGETGDEVDDPTRPWPPHRVRIMMGTMSLDTYIKEDSAECEKLSFNPCYFTDGIEGSNDPVLKARKWAYRYSSERRHATQCPMFRSPADDR